MHFSTITDRILVTRHSSFIVCLFTHSLCVVLLQLDLFTRMCHMCAVNSFVLSFFSSANYYATHTDVVNIISILFLFLVILVSFNSWCCSAAASVIMILIINSPFVVHIHLIFLFGEDDSSEKNQNKIFQERLEGGFRRGKPWSRSFAQNVANSTRHLSQQQQQHHHHRILKTKLGVLIAHTVYADVVDGDGATTANDAATGTANMDVGGRRTGKEI